MSEDNWRAALAEALEERFSYATQYATVIVDWDEEAEAIAESPALRDLLAERDKLAAQVQAVEGLADVWEADAKRHDDAEPINTDGLTRMILAARFLRMNASNLRRALGTPTTGGGE